MCVFTNVLNMRVCVSVSQCLLSADCADQLSDAAWVIGDQHGSLRVETETSLVQAVQGRSHQQYRVTSHRGQGALQGVKSECNQQVTGTMLRAVLMLSLVALSVTQRRPPPGVNKLCEFYDTLYTILYNFSLMTTRMQIPATLSRAGARAWTWVSSPSREERGLSSTLIRGTRSWINFN